MQQKLLFRFGLGSIERFGSVSMAPKTAYYKFLRPASIFHCLSNTLRVCVCGSMKVPSALEIRNSGTEVARVTILGQQTAFHPRRSENCTPPAWPNASSRRRIHLRRPWWRVSASLIRSSNKKAPMSQSFPRKGWSRSKQDRYQHIDRLNGCCFETHMVRGVAAFWVTRFGIVRYRGWTFGEIPFLKPKPCILHHTHTVETRLCGSLRKKDHIPQAPFLVGWFGNICRVTPTK